jgi:hypothetical protein
MNLKVLQPLSTAVRRDPEVLKAAKYCSEREFVTRVQQTHPEQHTESHRRLVFNPTASAAVVIEEAIEQAINSGEVASREEWLEACAAEQLQMSDRNLPYGMDEQADPRMASHTSGT